MFSVLSSIVSLLSSWGLLLIANSLLSTLLALAADEADFTTTTIGLVAAAYSLGLFVGAHYGDRLVIYTGHIRSFAAYASFTSVAALIHALVVDPYVWIVVRFGAGFAMAALVMITESWLNSRATNNTRGQILSFYAATNYLAAGIGQMLIPLARPDSFILFSVSSIFYSIALLPVLITRLIAPQVNAREKVEMIKIYRASPVAMLGAFASGIIVSAFYGLGPLFTQGYGKTTTVTALFMALTIFGGVLLQWPMGKLSDGMDRRKVIFGASVISALAAIAIVPAVGMSVWILCVAAVLFGAFAFTLYPIASAHMNDSTPKEKMMRASAGLLTAYGAGAVLGPIIASSLMEWTRPDALFFFIAGVLLMYSLLIIKRMKIKSAPKRKRRRMWFSRADLARNRKSEKTKKEQEKAS